MRRTKYQELIAEAENTPKIVDFVNAHPELMPDCSQNIWEVAHTTVQEMREVTRLTIVQFAKAVGVSERTVVYWCLDSPRGRPCPTYFRLALAEMVGLVKVPLEW